jgi:hypothetical protein
MLQQQYSSITLGIAKHHISMHQQGRCLMLRKKYQIGPPIYAPVGSRLLLHIIGSIALPHIYIGYAFGIVIIIVNDVRQSM